VRDRRGVILNTDASACSRIKDQRELGVRGRVGKSQKAKEEKTGTAILLYTPSGRREKMGEPFKRKAG